MLNAAMPGIAVNEVMRLTDYEATLLLRTKIGKSPPLTFATMSEYQAWKAKQC